MKKHYGGKLKENALPPLHELEKRNRHDVYDALCKATKECTNSYEKSKRAFQVLGALTPAELRAHLQSFRRVEKVLNKQL